jgi:diacylglycerol kinase (ATP)
VTDVPLFIVNPRAGGGLSGRTFAAVRAVAERVLGTFDVSYTEAPGHAIALARAAAGAGRRTVVAVGGDGTLNEVVNGVLGTNGGGEGTRVAMVGQGTGGDFRRALGLEHRLDRYLDVIARGQERTIDAGRVTYVDLDGKTRTRFFVNIVSAGLGGLVDRYVAEAGRGLGMRATYAVASLRAIAASEVGRLRVTSELAGARDERALDTYLIAVCNGRYFGSGMHVAPMAKIDDGRFEVVSLMARSKIAFTMMSRKLYAAQHLGDPSVTHFACRSIDLELLNAAASGRFLLDVDGEALGGLPARVEILPRALRMLV